MLVTATPVRVACLPGAPYDAVATHGFDRGDESHPARRIVRLTAFSIRYDETTPATDELLRALMDPVLPWADLVALVRRIL